MAIEAHLEELDDGSATGRAPRRTLRLVARGALASGDAADVLVHNISASGLLLECATPLAIGERIEVELPHAGATPSSVVWRSGNLSGCQFETPVSPATLSATQLRSAVGAQPSVSAAKPAAQESFGARLRRMRHERRLTQAEVATALGVSKPTVWAWEQDKSRPERHRIEALAEAVGVSSHELLAGVDAQTREAVVAGARSRIAAAFGTEPGSVRIMIEL